MELARANCFQELQVLAVSGRLGLLAQVLHAALEGQACLAGLRLLQCVLPQIVEELDMQQHQQVTDLTDPVLGLIGGQKTVLGGAGDLAVQGFEQEAHILGFGFGLDRPRGCSPGSIRPGPRGLPARQYVP